MSWDQLFVGRKNELEQFKKVLQDPKGQVILVVGQAGMGKTYLLNKMAQIAEEYSNLKCGCVRYEITPTDSVDSTMALMMDNAFESAQIKERSFMGTGRRLEQWRAFLNVFNLGDLVLSLQRDPTQNTRDQFLERLTLISKKMPENGRAIFIIDPEKYMQKDSDQSWAIVIKQLPERIKFVFAQRLEDVLVESETFGELDNVVMIPEERLDVLKEADIDELLDKRAGRLTYSVTKLREILSMYKGHPYAVVAVLDLIQAGIKLEELPKKSKPIEFARVQWKELRKRGKDAICLFKGYAILGVGVPDDVVEFVSKVDLNTRQHLLADKFLKGLLREEGEGMRIYHVILTDFILEQMSEVEKKEYHSRAVRVYRGKLKEAKEKQIKPDELAAIRLVEHVLETQGSKKFAVVFIDECMKPLVDLGLLDIAISLSERVLEIIEKEPEEEAILLGNLGIVYRIRGDLGKAEEMHLKSLEINKKLGRLEVMAINYGNLGNVYFERDNLDKAEEMYLKSLEINKKLGWLEGMAINYGNLGIVYRIRSDLDKAEEMHLKSLEINGRIGHLGGMAIQHANLGFIYQERGDFKKAKEFWVKSLGLYKQIGMPQMVEKVQKWIDSAEDGKKT